MSTFYKHVKVDIPYPYMKYVVGKKGNNLKYCCRKSGVNSVWFNVKRNIVEIYGPKDNLDDASKYIENLIQNVKRAKIPKTDLEEYAKSCPSYVEEENTSVEGSLEGALHRDKVKFLIGRKGIHFKKITQDAGINFIWYDDVKHAINLWGPKDKLQNAVTMLYEKITSLNTAKVVDEEMQICE